MVSKAEVYKGDQPRILCLRKFGKISLSAEALYLAHGWSRGSAKNPPFIEKIGKPPLFGEAQPPIRRA